MEGTNLKEYLAQIGMKLKDFCEIIECNNRYMSSISTGKRLAGPRLAKEVMHATSGKVTLKTRIRKKDHSPSK